MRRFLSICAAYFFFPCTFAAIPQSGTRFARQVYFFFWTLAAIPQSGTRFAR
jgi:hypothetical protein